LRSPRFGDPGAKTLVRRPVRRQQCVRHKKGAAFRNRFPLRRCSADSPLALRDVLPDHVPPDDGTVSNLLGRRSSRSPKRPAEAIIDQLGVLQRPLSSRQTLGTRLPETSDRRRLFAVVSRESL
jgi:hypothetical protein